MLFGDTTSRDCQLMAIYLSSTVVAKSLAMTFMMMIVQAAVVAPSLLLVSILPGPVATAASSFSLPVIDISGYSTTFRKCHELISEVNDGPQQIVQRYVEIDLCLRNNGNDEGGMKACLEYMLGLFLGFIILGVPIGFGIALVLLCFSLLKWCENFTCTGSGFNVLSFSCFYFPNSGCLYYWL